MAKRKKTNNDLQNTTQKTKDWATRIPLKAVVNSGAHSCKQVFFYIDKYTDIFIFALKASKMLKQIVK